MCGLQKSSGMEEGLRRSGEPLLLMIQYLLKQSRLLLLSTLFHKEGDIALRGVYIAKQRRIKIFFTAVISDNYLT